MYAEIRAWDVTNTHDREGTGKSMWVNDAGFDVVLSREPANHLGNPAWHLKITAATKEQRGATFGRYFERDLNLELTPDDIEKIVNFAFSNGLLTAKVRAMRRRR